MNLTEKILNNEGNSLAYPPYLLGIPTCTYTSAPKLSRLRAWIVTVEALSNRVAMNPGISTKIQTHWPMHGLMIALRESPKTRTTNTRTIEMSACLDVYLSD